jgi:hypothetical protein
MKTRENKSPRITFFMLLTAVIIFSSGCATTTASRSLRAEQVQTVLAQKSVKPETQEKVVSGEALSLDDIRHLNSKNIDDTIIVEAIEQSQVVYQLKSEDVSALKQAGVDGTVIDALLLSPHRAISKNPAFSRWHYSYPYRHHGFRHFGYRHFGYRHYRYYGGYHRYHHY